MTWKRAAAAALILLFLAVFGFASAIAGFLVLSSKMVVQDAHVDAMTTANVLIRLRDGRDEEAISILESQLGGDFVSHWAGFPAEDAIPEFWILKRLNLGGLQFSARYISDNPVDGRDSFIVDIANCHLLEDLPNPKDENAAYRDRIRTCYDRLR